MRVKISYHDPLHRAQTEGREMKKEALKSLVKKVCKQIDTEGRYIKTSSVKFDLFAKYRRKISVSYCQRLLARLDDEGFLITESRNMSNENIYLYKGKQNANTVNLRGS